MQNLCKALKHKDFVLYEADFIQWLKNCISYRKRQIYMEKIYKKPCPNIYPSRAFFNSD